MKIRRQQMAAFDESGRKSFESRLTVHIRTQHGALPIGTPAGLIPVSELSDPCLQAMVRHAMAKATKYGLSWESSVAGFTSLMFDIGPRFDEHPKISEQLLDEGLPANAKVDNLCYLIPEFTWQEVKAAHNALAWAEACPSLTFTRQEKNSV